MSAIIRALTGELADEHWTCLDSDTPGYPATFYWIHPLSSRCVAVEHRGGPHWVDGTAEGWFVTVCRHDEHGNPESDGHAKLGPFVLMGEAIAAARSIRRSILAERGDVAYAEQTSLFADDAVSLGKAGDR